MAENAQDRTVKVFIQTGNDVVRTDDTKAVIYAVPTNDGVVVGHAGYSSDLIELYAAVLTQADEAGILDAAMAMFVLERMANKAGVPTIITLTNNDEDQN